MSSERRYFEFASFRVDLANHLLLRAGEAVPLTPKAFDTLVELLEHHGEVLAKEELLGRLWPDTVVEEGNLTQNIYTLRKALAAAGDGQRFIETVPKRGYRFAAAVREVGQRPTSVAVLPFTPLLGADADPYLGLGMADALITRLSNLRQLNVRPTGAIRGYTDPGRDPLAVGRALAVDAVLDGTLQRTETRVRVRVQLVDVHDGAPRWAAQFDTATDDLFEVQDSISRQLASELSLELSRQEQTRLTRRRPADAEAYQAYLKGRYFWNRRSAEGLAKAIACFEQAIARDGAFVEAYAGLADCHVLTPMYGGVPPAEAFPRAKTAASRALELDADLAEAHTSLAYARFFFDWDWSAAGDGFRRAIALNPGYATAHHWYAYLLTALGRYDEAYAQARRALELDPLSLVINTDLGMVLYFARRPQEALEHATRTLELDPGFAYAHYARGHACQALGHLDDAVRAFERAAELSDGDTAMLAGHGQAMAAAGDERGAREVLAELAERARRRYVEPSHFAFLHAGLGEHPQALEHLARACQERSRFVVFLDLWPIFDPLRGEPAWRELMARVGLPARR